MINNHFEYVVVSEIDGIILSFDPSYVKVKLGSEAVVWFPRKLFVEKNILSSGQPIKYQIRQNLEGEKYQYFTARVDTRRTKDQEKIEELVAGFKFR